VHAQPPAGERPRLGEERALRVTADVEDDGAAVLADEVVVPNRKPAAAVGDVLVDAIVRLPRARARRGKRIDEMAAPVQRGSSPALVSCTKSSIPAG